MLTFMSSIVCLTVGYVVGLCKGRKDMRKFYEEFYSKPDVITRA